MVSIAAVLVLGGLVPAAATARPSARSARAADVGALFAYRDYLSGLIGLGRRASARVAMVSSGVAHTCPRALSDLTRLSASQVRRSALTSFGDEIDADLVLAYMSPSTAVLADFSSALAGLRWPTTAQAQIPSRLLSADRALIAQPAPDLCADAHSLDGAPLSEPTSTARFLARFRGDARRQAQALQRFGGLLADFETGSERSLVAQINALVARFAGASSATQRGAANRILSTLGVRQ